jgi:hypothetical protein
MMTTTDTTTTERNTDLPSVVMKLLPKSLDLGIQPSGLIPLNRGTYETSL